MSSKHFIGVDLGGTKILAGVFDGNLKCLVSDKNKTKLSFFRYDPDIVHHGHGQTHSNGMTVDGRYYWFPYFPGMYLLFV